MKKIGLKKVLIGTGVAVAIAGSILIQKNVVKSNTTEEELHTGAE